MHPTPTGVSRAIVLPGSGSDDVFVRAAFAAPLGRLGIPLDAPAPRPGRDVAAGYRAALDDALASTGGEGGRLLVGGISLGAHVAARWVAGVPARRLAGLLLALPAWTGPPGDAPAALAARASAAQVRAGGIESALAGAPGWLAAELRRAWTGYGAELAASLEAAAAEPGPTGRELAGMEVPAGVAALVDDPVHPLAVARAWCRCLPRAALVTTGPAGVAGLGADPAALGRAAVRAWLAARG